MEEREARLRELGKLIDNGQKIQLLLDSDGWKEIVAPLLDKMIVDLVGGREGSRWTNGSLDDKRLGEERLKSLMAYKRALTDFSNYVYDYVDGLGDWSKEYMALVSEHENPEFTQPMEDTSYAKGE